MIYLKIREPGLADYVVISSVNSIENINELVFRAYTHVLNHGFFQGSIRWIIVDENDNLIEWCNDFQSELDQANSDTDWTVKDPYINKLLGGG